MREWIYLLGTFGIPLFFLVNGYLLGNRDLSFKYVLKKAGRYLLFMAEWSLLLTIPYLIKKEFRFFSLLKGAITGSDMLYHLWFLTGLIVIYLVLAIATVVCRAAGSEVKEFVKKKSCLIWCIALLTVVFIANILMKIFTDAEIRDVIPAYLRIIDNGAYFVIGMHLKLNLDKSNDGDNFLQSWNGRLRGSRSLKIKCWLVVLLCYVIVCVVSELTGIIWASSYYTLPIVTLAVVLMFLLLLTVNSGKISERGYAVLMTSTGVWILHPLVLRVIKKIYTMLIGDVNLVASVLIMIVTIAVCIIAAMIVDKIKYVNRLFRP